MEHVTLLSADCLQRSEGLIDDRFPKEYPVQISRGFLAYVVVLGVFFAYSTLLHPMIFWHGVNLELFLFHMAYATAVFGYIVFQMPTAVVREVDALVIHFRCRKHVIPVREIKEVRIVHSMDFKSQTLSCKLGQCLWGFPTRLDKTVFVLTHSCCNNYQLGLADMEDFLKDNRPKDDNRPSVVGKEGWDELEELKSEVKATPSEATTADCYSNRTDEVDSLGV
eukprot:TRINITY_DN13565_c0_g1_i1.p1 TRINITY_DN13565_c0_g1~~TRINITY_DN13565_c0_g1_i1.p1  ORF type:complete len:223 (+),score=35.78 TRINITY_DN13565_c0_g1_i1:70-738(+)